MSHKHVFHQRHGKRQRSTWSFWPFIEENWLMEIQAFYLRTKGPYAVANSTLLLKGLLLSFFNDRIENCNYLPGMCEDNDLRNCSEGVECFAQGWTFQWHLLITMASQTSIKSIWILWGLAQLRRTELECPHLVYSSQVCYIPPMGWRRIHFSVHLHFAWDGQFPVHLVTRDCQLFRNTGVCPGCTKWEFRLDTAF